MDALLFGTAGIPCVTTGSTIDGIKDVKKLGLGAFELEFVRGVNIKEEKAPEIKKVSKENGVVLTNHAPYWINLNSSDKKKYYASINYIVDSAKIANLCGAYSTAFHAGFYQGIEKEKVYNKIKGGLKEIEKMLKARDINIIIRPELTGKPTQFGDLKELIKLSQDIENVMPCIDFAHLHARYNGKYNSYAEFSSVLAEIEKSLGRDALNNMHIHLAGINYNEKGERNHLNLKDSDMNYKDLLKAFKDFKIRGIVISESPNIEEDALMMKKACGI